MIRRFRRHDRDHGAVDGAVILIGHAYPIDLAPGHGLRAAPCLRCRQPIGDQKMHVIGVTGLHGNAYADSCVPSDVFIFHTRCIPIGQRRLMEIIRRELIRSHDHPWN